MRRRRRLLKKSREEGDADDSSSSILSRLPDEMILQILKKLKDLKSLCCCSYLVSKHFSSIVIQVDAISVVSPRVQIPDENIVGDVTPSRPIDTSIFDESSLKSVSMFLSKFKGLKSLFIELPSFSSEIGGIDNSCLFKWMVNFGSRIDSFYFLSPNSISKTDEFHDNGNGEEEEEDVELIVDLLKQKFRTSTEHLKDVIAMHWVLLYFIKKLPMLEEASITDSERRGGRLSLSGEKLSQVRKLQYSTSETVVNHPEVPGPVSMCYIPTLKLPVSGYVMKRVYLVVVEVTDHQGGNDFLMNNEDGFQDKEEAAYTEAVMEILENYKFMMMRLR